MAQLTQIIEAIKRKIALVILEGAGLNKQELTTMHTVVKKLDKKLTWLLEA